MIPSQFNYVRASSVNEAIQLLGQHGEDAKLLAGGHSLLPAMKLRLNMPSTLIDISKIADLNYIREENGQIQIGANTTHGQIAHSALIQEKLPVLSDTADMIGDVQIRNLGTIGGSLAHADPAADWPAAMLATDAQLLLQGPKGTRTIAAIDFFQGLFMTALDENEIITGITMPLPAANTHSTYLKFMQPASRFAIVGCAVMMTRNNGHCEELKMAFTGVSGHAFRDEKVEQAMKGQEVNDAHIDAASKQAAEIENIMSDHFASSEYRKHLAKVYAKRALKAMAS